MIFELLALLLTSSPRMRYGLRPEGHGIYDYGVGHTKAQGKQKARASIEAISCSGLASQCPTCLYPHMAIPRRRRGDWAE